MGIPREHGSGGDDTEAKGTKTKVQTSMILIYHRKPQEESLPSNSLDKTSWDVLKESLRRRSRLFYIGT